MGRCDDPDCNGFTEFDETAQATVCTNCGKVDSQTILRDDWDGEATGSSFYFGPTALKSLRRVGASLSGQYDKVERDMKNMRAMHQYIGTVLGRLSCSGLTERACTLFTQTRARKSFRWGKKALLVAGVCISIVLRENKKGVLLKDLSIMLDIPSTSLYRNIVQVSTILDIKLPPLDPLALLSSIQAYTVDLIKSKDTPLPKNLRTFIGSVSLVQTMRLASALIALIFHTQELPLISSPLSMTCAIFLVALEGQSADCIPSHPLLVKELGSRFGVRKDLVTTHYNALLNVITSWMEDVPWLSSSLDPDNLTSQKRRRKTSHRHVIALGIKEIVRFRTESLKAEERKCPTDLPIVCLEVAGHEDDGSFALTGRKRKREEGFSEQVKSMRFIRQTSKRKPLSQLDIASLSLLSPYHPFAPETLSKFKQSKDSTSLAKTIMVSSILPEDKRYSRLQLLMNERGGEAFIQDDELFDEKEFDDIFRNEDELNELWAIYGWSKNTCTDSDDSACDFEPSTEPVSAQNWNLNDLDFWEDSRGGPEDKQVDDGTEEQIIGEWREASPSLELQLDENDDY